MRTWEWFTGDDSYVKKVKSPFYLEGIGVGVRAGVSSMLQIVDSTLKPTTTTLGDIFFIFVFCLQ